MTDLLELAKRLNARAWQGLDPTSDHLNGARVLDSEAANALEQAHAELAALPAHGRHRMFPIQSAHGAKPHPTSIPWAIADLAYSVYSARYGKDQSLERMAERGGFSPGEMDDFLPDWRERVAALPAQVGEPVGCERRPGVAGGLDPRGGVL